MRWSYKTEHFSLKKEGLLGTAYLDEAEIELTLNEFGNAGWELVSFIEVNDGMIAVFKQPFTTGSSQRVHEDTKKMIAESAEAVSSNPDDEDVGDMKIL